MRIKLLLASLVLISSFILVAGQITHVSAVGEDDPITGPITGPITSPESPTPTPSATPTETPTPTPSVTPSVTPSPTPPITAPTSRVISGHISMRFIGFINSTVANVMVEASNVFTNSKVSGPTDSNGNYALNVNPGLYLVGPAGNNLFMPFLKVVNTTSGNATNVNFQNLILGF